jgi:hypothetical protein
MADAGAYWIIRFFFAVASGDALRSRRCRRTASLSQPLPAGSAPGSLSRYRISSPYAVASCASPGIRITPGRHAADVRPQAGLGGAPPLGRSGAWY